MIYKLIKKTVVTTALVGALVGGALVLAGPARTRAVIQDVKSKVSRVIDAHIDDPVALRHKLRELEREYPKRIASVRGDLAELNGQIRQLERERAISLRVVELAAEDLAVLQPKVDEMSAAAIGGGGGGAGNARLAAVSFGSHIYSLQRAATKVRQIENTRVAHANRAADAEHSLIYLSQQTGRFAEVLDQLESEQAQFQAQLFQLNRQVDSIQRNERLIEMLAERKRNLDECTSYDVASLDQITGKLEQILTRQEAELDVLAAVQDQADYEELAREQLMDETTVDEIVESYELGDPGTLQRVR